MIELFSSAKRRNTINGWYFKSNAITEIDYMKNKLSSLITEVSNYILETNELINQMVTIEFKTTQYIYKLIKNSHTNPFNETIHINNFDEKVNIRLKNTKNYSSIYEELLLRIFEDIELIENETRENLLDD